MNGTALGILGLISTLLFGFYAVWAYKKTRRKSSLLFLKKECYSLFEDDVNRLSIELTYKKKPIKTALILLKAKLVNDGDLDIENDKIKKPIKLICSENYEWLDSRIINQSNGVTGTIAKLNRNKIQFDWVLLKTGEFIEIETLVHVINPKIIAGNKVDDFYKNLTFDFRITDIKHIDRGIQLSDYNNSPRKITDYLFLFICVIGLYFLLPYYFPFLPNHLPKNKIEYLLDDGTNKEIGSIDVYNSKKSMLQITKQDDIIKLNIDDFNKKYKIEHVERLAVNNSDALTNVVLGWFIFLIGIIISFLKLYKPKNPNIFRT